jgi:hypothetical protein
VRPRLAAPAVALVLAAVLVAEGIALDTAWHSEEASIAEQARGGPSFVPRSSTAYPLVLRPLAAPLEGGWLLWIGRGFAAVAWAAMAMPTYLLARRWSSTPVAVGASVLAVLVPAAVYASALLPEAPATLLAACSLALYAHARERGDRLALGGGFALALAASLLRPWFAVLLPVLAVAAVAEKVSWRELRVWPRPLALVLLAGFAYIGVEGASPELERALLEPRVVLQAAAASVAVAALGSGIVPWLVAAARVAGGLAGAQAGVIAAAGIALALAAGVSGATGAGPPVDERPLLALVPFVFAVAARAWADRRPSWSAYALAGAGLTLAVLAIPKAALRTPTLQDAPGLEFAGRIVGERGTAGLIALALAVTVMTAVAASARVPALALATLTVLLVLPGHVLARQAASDRAQANAALLPSPHDWLDRNVDGAGDVTVLDTRPLLPGIGLRGLALWNRSLGDHLVADPTEANTSTGRLPVSTGTRFVLARGAEIAGTVVARHALGTLVRIAPPLRLAGSVEGVYPDGWSAERAVYRRFAGPDRPGTVNVTVSRRAWTGPDVPGTVIFSAGPVGRARSAGGIVIHSGEERQVPLRVPAPPFEVEITVDPTFSPADFGQADARRLGAQVTFTYVPDQA